MCLLLSGKGLVNRTKSVSLAILINVGPSVINSVNKFTFLATRGCLMLLICRPQANGKPGGGVRGREVANDEVIPCGIILNRKGEKQMICRA